MAETMRLQTAGRLAELISLFTLRRDTRSRREVAELATDGRVLGPIVRCSAAGPTERRSPFASDSRAPSRIGGRRGPKSATAPYLGHPGALRVRAERAVVVAVTAKGGQTPDLSLSR